MGEDVYDGGTQGCNDKMIPADSIRSTWLVSGMKDRNLKGGKRDLIIHIIALTHLFSFVTLHSPKHPCSYADRR